MDTEEDVVVLGPDGWVEVQRIIEEESTLPINEQTFLLWLGKEIVEEFLQYPAEVKRMCQETGLSTQGREVAETLFKKMTERLTELESGLSKKRETHGEIHRT